MNPLISATRPHHSRHQSLLAKGRPQPQHRQRVPSGVLHSRFALEQLTELAMRCQTPEFVMLLAPVFGLDLPPQVYLRLQTALQDKEISAPRCQIVADGFYPAEYDSQQRTVRLHSAALDYVQANPQAAWELLEILLHEFGHHLDTLLREDLSINGPVHRDAPSEEGGRYALRMARAGWSGAQPVLLASYQDNNGQPVSLHIDAQQALKQILSSESLIGRNTGKASNEHHEQFEATGEQDGKFSHERIERRLLKLGLSEHERQTIYFGNWLRDYSQLLDPKLVSGPGMAKAFPKLLSRQALTEIVDILATRRFAEARLRDPDSFKVTAQRLGVYRPSEHIDNPRVETAAFDLTERDADFEPWVLAGDPALQVDFATSMKGYIQRSIDYMQDELRAAMQHGRTPEGLRRFGAALHVLEDFFAHSNFIELGLTKLGYPVLAWTSPVDCKWQLPLVTGRFAGADVIASLAQPVARLIAPDENWQFNPDKPGELSDTDRMLLVLLNEHRDTSLLSAYENWIEARDVLRENRLVQLLKLKAWAQTAPLRLVSNAWNEVQRGVLSLLGSHVDDAQTLFDGDPNSNGSSDPTHSQLAKDHAEHPLHEPAGLLASQAVGQVAQAMIDHWSGQPGEDPLHLAASFFCHARDSDWQDELLAEWAISNPHQIERASSLTELQTLQEQLHSQLAQTLHNFEQQSRSTWDYLKGLFEHLLGDLISLDTAESADL
ncbi:Het-C domain-containing protein [Pseudomonas sp. 21LCFQ02]|uniref:Het-C domain-containing protein n=1 Tax=Pseudomonas sp. 21LCFQ02 TaxID=2957505 RepID=UPI00209BAC6E|nr:Het-C domain-containing protein [Pseudomonas sp. 21LCFQ02]MCO8170221.1 Het-C domain-containing protein [Pseudomonas sp. 21LCFQ02]